MGQTGLWWLCPSADLGPQQSYLKGSLFFVFCFFGFFLGGFFVFVFWGFFVFFFFNDVDLRLDGEVFLWLMHVSLAFPFCSLGAENEGTERRQKSYGDVRLNASPRKCLILCLVLFFLNGISRCVTNKNERHDLILFMKNRKQGDRGRDWEPPLLLLLL